MKSRTKVALTGLALSLGTGVMLAAPAAENWENNCASCHGADGKGQTKQGKKLKVSDYTDAKMQAQLKDEDMLKAVLEGVKDKASGKERMKGFKEETSEAEAKDLVAYIRKFKA